MVYVIQVLLTVCEQDQDGTSSVYHSCVYREKLLMMDRGTLRTCRVFFFSKNKVEKLVHLVGFIIRIYHDARSPERQILLEDFIFVNFILFSDVLRAPGVCVRHFPHQL